LLGNKPIRAEIIQYYYYLFSQVMLARACNHDTLKLLGISTRKIISYKVVNNLVTAEEGFKYIRLI